MSNLIYFILQSQVGSRASKRSQNSYVDESLFGKKGAQGGVKTSTGVITLDELRNIRGKTEKNNQNDAVIISKNDLMRIKDATTIKTKDQVLQEKALLEEQKEAAAAKAKARKERMQQLDQTRANKMKPNDW